MKKTGLGKVCLAPKPRATTNRLSIILDKLLDSIPEIEQLLRCDAQHLAELEHDVKGNADVAELDGADVAAVDADQLRKLQLRHFPAVGNELGTVDERRLGNMGEW